MNRPLSAVELEIIKVQTWMENEGGGYTIEETAALLQLSRCRVQQLLVAKNVGLRNTRLFRTPIISRAAVNERLGRDRYFSMWRNVGRKKAKRKK